MLLYNVNIFKIASSRVKQDNQLSIKGKCIILNRKINRNIGLSDVINKN